MEEIKTLILKWTKYRPDGPWSVLVQYNGDINLTLTVGKRGKVASKSLLEQTLTQLDSIPTDYPFEYNMMTEKNRAVRTMYITILGDKATSADIDELTAKHLRKNMRQTGITPSEESIEGSQNLVYKQTMSTMNQAAAASPRVAFAKNLPTVHVEYASTTNRYWLFYHASAAQAEGGDGFSGYVAGYGWPEGNEVPAYIGDQPIREFNHPSQVNYLGLTSFKQPLVKDTSKHFNPYPDVALPEIEGNANIKKVTLDSVVDGDTFKFTQEDGTVKTAHMLLINTPKTDTTNRNQIKYGQQAKTRTRQTLESAETLYVEYDAGDKQDTNDNELVYVWADGKLVQEILVLEGLARIDGVSEKSTKYFTALVADETHARQNKLNIWTVDNAFDAKAQIPQKLYDDAFAEVYPSQNNDRAKAYNVSPTYIDSTAEEARRHNEALLKQGPILATSLQYNAGTGKPSAGPDGELLGVTYSTDYPTVESAQKALRENVFKGRNINKALLSYMSPHNTYLQAEDASRPPLPLVEYTGGQTATPSDGIKVSTWKPDLGLRTPPQIGDTVTEEIDAPTEDDVGGEDAAVTTEKREDKYPAGFMNNDISFIPAYDDRLENGLIYRPVPGQAEDYPWDYVARVRIGDVFLPIPPLNIRVDKQYETQNVDTMRSQTPLQKQVGMSRNILTLDLYFATTEDINGTPKRGYAMGDGEVMTYYMDGLRPLLSQFKKAPFLPIDNEYINMTLGIHNVVMRNLKIESVPGFPEALKAVLILEEFDSTAYLMQETQLGSLMNYPLLRYYYQRSLNPSYLSEPWRTYLPPVERLDNEFFFKIADENMLIARQKLMREFKELVTPKQYKRETKSFGLPNEVKDDSDIALDAAIKDEIRQIKDVLRQYDAFMSEWDSKAIMSKYEHEQAYAHPQEVPIIVGDHFMSKHMEDDENKMAHEIGLKIYGRFGNDTRQGGYAIAKTPVLGVYNEKNFEEGRFVKPAFYHLGLYKDAVNQINFNAVSELNYVNSDYYVGQIKQEIDEHNLPGFFQLRLTSKLAQDTFDPALEISSQMNVGDEVDNPQGTRVFVIPAGDIGEGKNYITQMRELMNRLQNIDQDLQAHQDNYNRLADKVNGAEVEIEMDTIYIPNLVPISMTTSFENKFSTVQVQDKSTPTMQFFGSLMPEVQLTFETTDDGIAAIERMLRKIGMYVKRYRDNIVSGYMDIDNDMLKTLGIKSVLPQNVQYQTVPNFPDRKIVTMTLTGFDKTQRRQEALYGFTAGDPSKNLKDRAYDNYDPATDGRFVHERMRQLELYPDLELPRVSELNAVLPHIQIDRGNVIDEWINRTDQVFLDPDFYISTTSTLRKIVNDYINGDEDIESRQVDSLGYVVDSSLKKNDSMQFVATSRTPREFEDEAKEASWAGQPLIWESYKYQQGMKRAAISTAAMNLEGAMNGNMLGGMGMGSMINGTMDPNATAGTAGMGSIDIPPGLTDLPIQKDIIANGGGSTAGKGNDGTAGITLHQTGNTAAGAGARWHADYLRSIMGQPKSWHWTVDDKVAIQSFAHDERCFHAGDGTGPGNYSSIGIEVCINSDGNYNQAIENAAKLMASICYINNWNPLTDIKTHQDRSGKYCPEQILNNQNGISLQQVYQKTNQYLNQIRQSTPQGGPIEVQKEIKARVYNNEFGDMPSNQKWTNWGKPGGSYENFQAEIKANLVDTDTKKRPMQHALWWQISDSVRKHFGDSLDYAEVGNAISITRRESEKLALETRTASFYSANEYAKNKHNLENYYINSPAALKPHADYYYFQRINYFSDGRALDHGEPFKRSWYHVKDVLNTYDQDKVYHGRVIALLYDYILTMSNGEAFDNGKPHIYSYPRKLQDKNKVGIMGANLYDASSGDEAERLMWDWRYNVDKVIDNIASVFNKANHNYYVDIRANALPWALVAQGNTLPQVITRQNSDKPLTDEQRAAGLDSPTAFNGTSIIPTNDMLYQNIMNSFENRKQNQSGYTGEHASILYRDLAWNILSQPQMIYVGIPASDSLGTPDMEDILNRIDTEGLTQDEIDAEIDRLLNENRDNPDYQGLTWNGGPRRSVEDAGINEEAVEEAAEDIEADAEGHHAKESAEERLRLMFVDMIEHDHVGRLLRAFPTFSVHIIDEGKWYGSFKMWDNFYGYNALVSVDVYKSRKIAADTAIVNMSNMYGGISTKREDMEFADLSEPSFFSNHFLDHYVLGNPTQEMIDAREEIFKSMFLEAGARLHVRMGYGADARRLPITFNGTITSVSLGDVVEVIAQGDGLELTNTIGGNEEDQNKTFMGFVKEPRQFMGEMMTSKGNWLKDMINQSTNGYLFKESPLGISHFGTTHHAEDTNVELTNTNENFGEAMDNVYSTNGRGQRSQYQREDGTNIPHILFLITEELSNNLHNLSPTESTYDEDNILLNIYGTTPWDIIQTYAMTHSDYVASVVPFEFRSTLFFGIPHWTMYYAQDSSFEYDEANSNWVRTDIKRHSKTFMQVHFATSQYGLISNDIKVSADGTYTNAFVEYDGHSTEIIQVDNDIRYDQQRTVHLSADIISRHDNGFISSIWNEGFGRNFQTSEVQSEIYGHSALRDYMKDMYKGSYTMVGDATIKPYDVMYLSDTVQDIQGVHLVKAVHHTMSLETGFVSIVEPDAYAYNFDAEMLFLSDKIHGIAKDINTASTFQSLMPSTGVNGIGFASYLIGSAVGGKLMKHADAISATVNRLTGQVSDKYSTGIFKKSTANYLKEIGEVMKDGDMIDLAIQMGDPKKDLDSRLVGQVVDKLNATVDNWKSSGSTKYTELAKSVASQTDSKYGQYFKKQYQGTNMKEAIDIAMEQSSALADDLAEYGGSLGEYEDFLRQLGGNLDELEDLNDARLIAQQAKKAKIATSMTARVFPKMKLAGTVIRRVVTSPIVVDLVIGTMVHVLVSSIVQMWTSRKHNANAVKIVPLSYKGSYWTAGITGHRGAVASDTPSRADDWMNAEFFDGKMSEDITRIIPAILNTLE